MEGNRGARALVCLVLICFVTALGAPPAGAKVGTELFLVAGVPGTNVDVLVDDEVVESDVEPTAIVGPIQVSRGQHTVTFRSGDWSVNSNLTAARPSLDVVVHRPADPAADPTVTVFGNDLAPISADKSRLTIAHTAVVPPADVRASGKVLFTNIANGEFVTAEVPPATYSVDIVATGGSDPVFGPVDVTLKAGALNRVFAIGDPEEGTMNAIVQVLPLRSVSADTPTSVAAGSAGQVATAPRRDGWAGAALPFVLVGLLMLAAGVALPRREPRRDVPRGLHRAESKRWLSSP